MERQQPLADYASNIDLHPDILHRALTGHLKGADSHPLNALAKAINRDPQQLDLTTPPCDESFRGYLKIMWRYGTGFAARMKGGR